jgi:hypothetical protein
MTKQDGRDFFRDVIVSGLKHPAMALGLVAGLISGGFVAGVGWNMMQSQIGEVSRGVTTTKSSMVAINTELRHELKRLEVEMRANVNGLSGDLSEMKSALARVDTAIQFLVQDKRRETRNDNSGRIRQ